MSNYKLTLPRTILFSVILLGGIYYFIRNGFGEMATYEIVLSVVLMVILLALLLIRFSGAVRNRS